MILYTHTHTHNTHTQHINFDGKTSGRSSSCMQLHVPVGMPQSLAPVANQAQSTESAMTTASKAALLE